ncbi:ABC transporter permease [Caulobacter sp. RL271]|jgi:ABC-2 type transport system permease protein|uniref:ABC transporter permease n=1 Tax=Caulobacter segnis TaxID=88688 RepID=A0ABY5A0W8_9CAUL|nr:ABC transporter permease [Caulobacter segnis]USQ97872.1 ABC transporter permease [Caulobacter segnis]
MLADAIAAERFRLLRDRSTMFWGFCFAPLVGFVLSVGGDLFMRHVIKKPMPGVGIGLVDQVIKALATGFSTFDALFLMIGAAAVLAGDYRWETWRLLTPRNTRQNLLLAKLIVVGEAMFWSLVLTAVLSAAAGVIGAGINGKTLSFSMFERGPFDILGVLAITWLEAMTLAALAACVGVLSRSTLGVVIACLGVRVVQTVLASSLRLMEEGQPSWKLLALPVFDADLLRAALLDPAQLGQASNSAGAALIALLAWTTVLAGGAVLLFRRQDLTKE